MDKQQIQDMLSDCAELMVILSGLYGATHHELRQKNRALDILKNQIQTLKIELAKIKTSESLQGEM